MGIRETIHSLLTYDHDTTHCGGGSVNMSRLNIAKALKNSLTDNGHSKSSLRNIDSTWMYETMMFTAPNPTCICEARMMIGMTATNRQVPMKYTHHDVCGHCVQYPYPPLLSRKCLGRHSEQPGTPCAYPAEQFPDSTPAVSVHETQESGGVHAITIEPSVGVIQNPGSPIFGITWFNSSHFVKSGQVRHVTPALLLFRIFTAVIDISCRHVPGWQMHCASDVDRLVDDISAKSSVGHGVHTLIPDMAA
mmetsp:Transcript_21320/g.34467  ORF Transcript_21320/g.34467 Transcript_21320/m.34467 type:complete len:249 (+) Transcript_21320:2240-2986(+)